MKAVGDVRGIACFFEDAGGNNFHVWIAMSFRSCNKNMCATIMAVMHASIDLDMHLSLKSSLNFSSSCLPNLWIELKIAFTERD